MGQSEGLIIVMNFWILARWNFPPILHYSMCFSEQRNDVAKLLSIPQGVGKAKKGGKEFLCSEIVDVLISKAKQLAANNDMVIGLFTQMQSAISCDHFIKSQP